VVQASSGSEHLAAAEIRALGIDVYLPEFVQRIRHARKSRLVRKALFQGYLFVQFDWDDAQWPRIFSRRGVTGMIMDGRQRPRPVPEKQMAEVRKLAGDYEDIILEAVPLTEGQVVKIIEGAFSGFTATVRKNPKGSTVSLQTTIFGQPTPIILPRDHVAPVAQQ